MLDISPLINKIVSFYSFYKHCYYRGYYICHRDDFKSVIFELEGIDIDDVSNILKEA